MDIKKLEHAV